MNAAPARAPPARPKKTAALRRIGFLWPSGRLLLRCRRRRLLPRRLPRSRFPCRCLSLRLRRELAERTLEVVEHESDGRLRSGRRDDARLPVEDNEHAALQRRDLELCQRPGACCDALSLCEEIGGGPRE